MNDQEKLIRALISREVASLHDVMETVHLADGEVLFHRGDPGDAFYIVESGHVRIYTYDEEGKELTLNTLERGDAFGELALVDSRPRSASVVAVGPATLRRLDRDAFLAKVHSSPALSQAVIQLLGDRARHMISYVEWLGQWTRLVAEGHYDQAMKSLQSSKDVEDDALLAVADAVESMVRVVREREEALRLKVAELRIQIDEEKRRQHVAEITETDYFQELVQHARQMREQRDRNRAEFGQKQIAKEVLMAKIISIHSFRGGTGKSNISANVAVQLALRGKRVGVIDTDIQSPGIHVLFGINEDNIGKALNDYLWGRCKIEEAAHDMSGKVGEGKTGLKPKSIYLIPSSLRAGEIARVLREGYDVGLLNEGFQALIDELGLDYLVIDTHPGLNEETLLSIAISNTLFVVMRPDQQDFQGTAVTVDVARKLEVPDLFLIINKALSSYDFDDLKQHVEEIYDCPVATIIPLSEDVARLASAGIFTLVHPDHKVSRAIAKIVDVVEATR